MSSEAISAQLASLAAEAREHTLYLHELGVENLEAELSRGTDTTPGNIPPPPAVAKSVSVKAPTRVAAESKPEPPPQASRTVTGPATRDSLFGNIFEAPQESLPESNETFEQIHADVGACTRCPLAEGRTHIVHTEGNRTGRLMFVGEAPGADEDAQARPFVGRAGQLLTKIIEAIGFKREDVLIGNINRCRPPGNRAPVPDEVAACKTFLLREIASARPEVIVVLGNTAMKNLLDIKEGITRVRGQFQNYKGIKVMPTFHPAYLLRDPSKKRETWEDLKKVRDYLDNNKA